MPDITRAEMTMVYKPPFGPNKGKAQDDDDENDERNEGDGSQTDKIKNPYKWNDPRYHIWRKKQKPKVEPDEDSNEEDDSVDSELEGYDRSKRRIVSYTKINKPVEKSSFVWDLMQTNLIDDQEIRISIGVLKSIIFEAVGD